MGCGASASPSAYKVGKDSPETIEFLSQVPLLKSLSKAELQQLAVEAKPCSFKQGEVIIRQNDVGHECYVILDGEVSVTVGSSKVATLKKGDYFGEKALLHDEPRSATITVDQPLSALEISQDKFRELGLINKVHFAHRKAIGGAGRGNAEALNKGAQCAAKTPEERKFLVDAIRANDNLKSFFPLTDEQVNEMIDVCWKESVPINKVLIMEGDIDADFFYVVESGQFDITVQDKREARGGGRVSLDHTLKRSRSVKLCGKGHSFGEMALFFLAPRSATVTAMAPSSVWVFDRYNLKRILMKVSAAKLGAFVRHLKQVEIFKSLQDDEYKALAEALVEIHYNKGEKITEQDTLGNSFMMLVNGEVIEKQNGKDVRKMIGDKRQGSVSSFGEQALLGNDKRSSTIEVSSKSAEVLAIDRESFMLLLGPLDQLMQQGAARAKNGQAMPQRGPPAPQSGAKNSVPMSDLKKIGLLGNGGFGTVELFENKKTQETYAMKGVSKGYIVKLGMQKDVMNEKSILAMCDSPFIIKLHGTYNEPQMLYFLLEAALGGELFAIYNRKGFHGSEKHALFYSAGVTFAFEFLHSIRVIYRDLKPENIMLTESGNCKLTDMGLAKYVIGKTFTTCGTPDYFAPELVKSQGYTNAVDWWTLGVLIFEMMSGFPPFESANPAATYKKIKAGIAEVQFPPKCRGGVAQMVKDLLHPDPSERPPMRIGGIRNLQQAPLYKGFDWSAFQAGTMTPPYIPKVKNKKDLGNFDASPDDRPDVLKYVDDGSGWDKDF